MFTDRFSMLHRRLALVAAGSLLVALAGCGSESPDATPDTPETPPVTTDNGGSDDSAGTGDGGDANASTAPTLGSRIMLGGISLKPGTDWVVEPTSNSMRVAQYRLPGAPVGEADGTYVITHFGNQMESAEQMQANLDRWIAQVTQPDGTDSFSVADIGKHSIDNMAVITLDVTGSYATTRPTAVEIPNARLMVWIIHNAIEGPFFVKVVGPKATIDHWEASLRESYQTVMSTS